MENYKKVEQANKEKDDVPKRILTNMIENIRKEEREHFARTLNPATKEMQECLEEMSERNEELQSQNFKNKIALITFNGALIALMVSSSNNIGYKLATFLILFGSFSVGIIQLIIFYLTNEYKYIKENLFGTKCKEVFKFCQEHKDDQGAIVDTQAFIRQETLKTKTVYNSIPHLLKIFDKEHNLAIIFTKTLAGELLFYIPLLIGFWQVLYSLFIYLSKTS